MKKYLQNEYLFLFLRILLGIIFIFASIEKIQNTSGFAQSIANYRLLPEVLLMPSATVLPWLELLAGFCILVGVFHRGGSLIISTLMAIFTVAVLSALIRHLDISCGCFTQDPSASRMGWTKFFENLILTAAAVLIFLSDTTKLTLERYFREKQTSPSEV